MIFKEYFKSFEDVLEVNFDSIQKKGKNNSDIGELCEMFIEDLLNDLFNDQFKIFRGGQIINIDNKNLSKQMDIILTAKNTVTVFGAKRVFPIESVYSVFSVTSNLNHRKLFDKKGGIIEEFKSIPKDNPKFHSLFSENPISEDDEKLWSEIFPYKCVFGFKGGINEKWEKELNGFVKNDDNLRNKLPDLIVVNKKGMIQKIKLAELKDHDTDFEFTKFDDSNCGLAIAEIINDLHNLSIWQNSWIPDYREYFISDFNHEDS